MPTDKPRWLVTVTPEMNQKMNEIVMSDDWTMTKTQTIRLAITEFLEKHGKDIQEEMPQHGGNRYQK